MLPLDEKKLLYEWLVRLEKTKDYSRDQEKLAHTALEILKSIQNNPEFRTLFFVQVSVNNEDCQDRSAMSFNEIYTSWKILNLPKDTPLQDKLRLLIRAAKTLALRARLAQLIQAQGGSAESVEIKSDYR